MITEYEIRVRRPWRPGMKKGDLLKVSARQKVQYVRGGFAELVGRAKQEAQKAVKKVLPRNPTRKRSTRKRSVVKKKV